MTKRKPLTWTSTDYGDVPDCVSCLDWLWQPHMAEAIASVGIETGGVDVHRMVGQYHANRHKEES